MLINEVCRECSLTKKAIEYYIGQGIVVPAIQENGYRNFSDEDIVVLKKVSVLRTLGLSVADIHDVLSNKDAALNEVYHRKTVQMFLQQEKQELIQELASKHDWEQIQGSLHRLQKKQMVLERLTDAFPGYYGKFLCLHFAPYLNCPVLTDKQQEAFDVIIAFLDSADFDIPNDLKGDLDEITLNLGSGFMEAASSSINGAVSQTETYIADHHEEIESYLAYKRSEEYETTPAGRLEKELRRFNSMSGYNDIFIPAMCQLSESYRKYHEGLSVANEMLSQKYPEME
ncbi:MAG: MerR family transcriptional regulator [Lachnospiraceae bacterium]|nr:MerR family transcriptional regulator [Lachnospiraceae bacterium]